MVFHKLYKANIEDGIVLATAHFLAIYANANAAVLAVIVVVAAAAAARVVVVVAIAASSRRHATYAVLTYVLVWNLLKSLRLKQLKASNVGCSTCGSL